MKTIIFDFDGVIIDSTEVQRKAFSFCYQQHVGKGEPPFERFLNYNGDSLENIIEKMNLPTEMIDDYRDVASRHANEIHLFEGMRELIAEIKARGLNCGLCTGKERKRTVSLLHKLDLISYFDVVVCSDDVANPKPSPDSLFVILEQTGSRPDESVFIGDSLYDIRAARSAGVQSVAVTWGDASEELLSKEHPDAIRSSVEELRALLFDYGGQS